MSTVTKTLTLVPSGYTGLTSLTTSSSYPISNAYKGSGDTSTYARLSLSTSTTGYLYLTFDTSDVPSGATITGVSGTVTVRVSSTSRVTSTVCQLYSGTTAKGSNVTFASTSTSNTVTLTPGTWTASELGDLRLRIGGTGSSSSQSKYIYLYGATITVSYTVTAHDITISNSTSATVTTSAAAAADGDSVTISASTVSGIVITDNGTDVTNQFTAVYPESTASTVLGTYTLVSGGFNSSGASWFQGIVGNGADTTETTTSNYYSSGSGTIAVFTYEMGITIPSNATVTRLWCEVSGHAESTSNSSEYMCAQLVSGSTDLSDELNFKSVGTSNSIQTLEATTLPTVAQLAAMKLQCRLGYYGGAINGATAYVEYEVPGQTADGYVYTIENVTADHAIVVSPSGGQVSELYVKDGGSWVKVSAAYVKSNGVWGQVSVDSAFQSGANYVKG